MKYTGRCNRRRGIDGLHRRLQVDCVATVESATRTRAKLAPPLGLGVDLYRSMPRSLARACGAEPDDAHCLLTHDGGNSAQWLVNHVADRIASRDVKSALLSGCEVRLGFGRIVVSETRFGTESLSQSGIR